MKETFDFELDPKDLVAETRLFRPQQLYVLRHVPTGVSRIERVDEGEAVTEELRASAMSRRSLHLLVGLDGERLMRRNANCRTARLVQTGLTLNEGQGPRP